MSSVQGAGSQLTEVDYDPFAGGSLARVVPTTEPQREVWLACKLSPEASLGYNESVSFRFRGRLDAASLAAAIGDVQARHESLRATISANGEEMHIAADAAPAVEIIDHRGTANIEVVIAAARLSAVKQSFNLETGPLFNAQILVLADTDHLLVVSAHHIVFDGWSAGIFARDLAACYRQRTGLGEDLPPAASYGDYALAQRAGNAARDADEAYWLSRFAGPAPVLDLPTDRSRPALRRPDSLREDYTLPASLVADVRKAGAARGASLFVSLLAGFASLMQRIAGNDDIVIGVPTAGQSVGGQDTLVGHCVNLLPLRLAVDSAATMAALVDATQTAMLDAYEHQEYTFGTLLKKLAIERDPSRLPLVNVMFNLDQALDANALGFGCDSAEFSINPRVAENFELSINAVQKDGALILECQYSTALFDAGTVRRWLQGYEKLLAGACAQPQERLAALSLLGAADQAEIALWNATTTAFSRDKFVHELFEAHAAAAPDTPSIVWQGGKITYAALDARANTIAHAMAARGAGPGKLVGLHLSRGPDMVASLLAALKTGAGYVPLDPSYPQDRLAYMVEDAALALLVTDTTLPATVATLQLNDLPASAGRVVMPAQSTEAVAYVIYTSGSTGKPKGVQVPHRSVVNFLETMAKRPGFTAADRVVAVTTLSFDIAVNELLLPLSIGAAVVLASKEEAGDGQLLAKLLDSSGATTMQATPATWRMLIDAGWHGPAGFKALAGGEALSADLATALLERASELWNMYGPTETTVWSTCCRIDNLSSAISIGTPIANTSIRVLDEVGNECPVGVPGEIWIGGDGVTLGYLNRPELTAERFVRDRFSGGAGALLYRTGDRGRWRADGMVEHLGRLDFQVKVRGYRIELGEIESAIAGHPDVARAVVIVREDRKGDVRLVAYVVPRADAVSDAELGAHVRKTLPEYMVPQHVVALTAIPLLPNGKVDRKSLPAPVIEARSARAFVAPRTPMESTVATAMAGFLALPEIGVHDDFFAMGGHSLLASQLTARLARELNLQVPMRAVFEAATPESLARWVENEQKKGGKSRWAVPRRVDQSVAPLSAMQQRMWFVEQLDPGQPVNNSPSAHRLRGALDEQAFNRAFGAMVARQHGLRTSIEMDGDSPVQVIHDDIDTNLLPACDLSTLPREVREKTMMAEIVEAIRTPFDLSVAPLYRAKLYRLDKEEYVFFFMPHHIVWDGWSFDLLYHDMAALYGAFREGKPSPLPELAVSYGDFSAWHAGWMESDEMTGEVQHWKERLAGHTEPLALPADYPRPDLLAGNAKMLWLPVSAETVAATRELAREADATLFMTLLSVYVLMLSQATGQRDLVIATPVRGRQVEELEPIMGFFVNALPLRLAVRENITFLELLADVKATVLDSFKHPDVPFERLVRELDLPRDNSRTPIYQTMFSYQDARKRILRWGNLDRERVEVMQPGVAGDMNLWCVELQKGLLFGFSYAPEILSDASAVVLRDRYMHLLNQLLTAPATHIDALPLPGTEAAQLAQWNATRTAHDRSLCVHTMTAKASAEHAETIAVQHGEATISHRELDQRANRIANALAARGVGRGQLVGLCVERGIGMLAAQLGILKSGAAYVPLDPAYPQDRIAFMVEDAAMPLIVAEPATAAQFGWPPAKVLLLDDTRNAPATAPAVPSQPSDAAYVIYTSGSTGKPKGVIVPHSAAVNFLHTMRDKPGLTAGDRVLAVTTLSFDIAVLELLLPLTVGATVVMADREQALDGHALTGLIAASGANVMQATPATWRLLLDAGWRGSAGFKALIGGEALSIDLAQRLLPCVGELWNMYGPTETTVWSTCWKVEHPERGIVIGKPIANTTVHVLDEHRRPCPLGAAGEIWIGGEGVATGYHHRPDLTAERFIADPFATEPGARLYRTGDCGRWRADGRIEHLGRLDFQVKVRGYRIELGEIESCMAAFPGVKQAVVLAREDVPGDVRLVAYLAAASVDSQALRDHARRTLPAYMVPQHFVALPAIPLLPNGKVDRKALPKPSETAQGAKSAASHIPPTTETEKALAAIWADLLKISDINADDNFFDIGGHSLLGMQAIAIMETKTGKRVNPRRYIFETLSQIARGYDETEGAPAEKPGTLKRFLNKLVGGGKGSA